METSSTSNAPYNGLATFRRCVKEIRRAISEDVTPKRALRATMALAEHLKPPGVEAADFVRQAARDRLSRLYRHDAADPAEAKPWRAFSRRCLAARGEWDEAKYLCWLVVAAGDKVLDHCSALEVPEFGGRG